MHTPNVVSPQGSDRLTYWFGRHWLAVFNLVVLLYAGLPVLAPVLMHAGLTGPGELIYKLYYPLCHQQGYRSFFLFGEQPAYPRAQFQTLTGINTFTTEGFVESKDFLGNAQLGYKMAMCERDVAIYGALFAAGLLFGLVRARLRPAHWLAWAVVGLVPIALDGGSQLISQVQWAANPLWRPDNPLWRESTPWLRVLTGALFGASLVWLAYPYVEDAMLDVCRQLERQFGWRG